MAFLLALVLSAANGPPPARVEHRAQVQIRVLRPHRASAESWDPAGNPSQKEVIRKEKDGSPVRLRLTEFE